MLIRPEQEELRELHDRLDDKEQRAHEIASVLPEAVTLSADRSEELTRALQPAVEGSIRESIEKRPRVFIDALHPIIGSVVRRSIAETLRTALQSLNQSLEQSFSWQNLKWRFEAFRTGRSFAEVVMLRSHVYRVEQIFLIHRETSLSLLHVSTDAATTQDSDMVAGMLSAIQDFARDSFKTGNDEALEEFRVGELQVWIASGAHAYLAAVIRGNPPRDLRICLRMQSRAFMFCAALLWRSSTATRPPLTRSGRNWSRVCARNIRRKKLRKPTIAPGLRSRPWRA